MELCLNPELIKKWTKIKRKEAKEGKKAGKTGNSSEMLENKFLRNLMEEFLEVHLENCSNLIRCFYIWIVLNPHHETFVDS